ncbi:MAG TPA: ABC transporter permease [Puia sp.]|nr:ABC transporter permease [Puia sp.]
MIDNYFKTTLRSLVRNKSYAAINIVGLAVGIAACLLIFLVVQFELSFDNFHKNKDRIYRLVSVPEKEGTGFNFVAGVPLPVAEGLRIDYPRLEKVAAIFGRDGQITVPGSDNKVPEKKFNEADSVFFAEPSFFDIFHFEWLAGNPKTALTEPNTVVLTREAAEKYFGDWRSAIGKTLKFQNKDLFRVTGILKDIPVNTDLPLKIVFSYRSLKNVDLTDWVGTYGRGYCFALLPPGMSPSQFNIELKSFVKRHKPAGAARKGIALQPLADMHFDPKYDNFNGRVFSKELITALSLIGLFLLVIACVNFVNLATAQVVNRSREAGIRKVLGGRRKQLILQFMGEAGLITVLAVLLAISLAAIALPYLNTLLRLRLSLDIIRDRNTLLFLLLVTISVTTLSGFYPALIMSGFNPIHTLKNKITAKMVGGISLRRGLVVLQFGIAQALIIGVLVVMAQTDYFRNAAMGFDKEAILNVPIPSDSLSQSRMETVRNRLSQQPGIKNISFSTYTPSDNTYWSNNFTFDHSTHKTDFQASFKWADTAYFNTYNIQFLAGRPYEASDTLRELVVNETLVNKLGIRNPRDIIGKEISFWDKRAQVVGVVKDFHASSLHDPIVPVLMGCWKETYGVIGIRIQPERSKQTLTAIEKIWNAAYPQYVYEYQFLDEKINNFYQDESRLAQLYKIFAGIAIFISCLGLYGLVSFMAAQRTKEVGVRKVLGASVAHIMYLFSREFTILIGLAFLIAAPLAYYFMQRWLEGFVFRIRLGFGIFLLAIAGSLLIAWLTVAYRAFKAAMANPVKSLRTE